MSIEDNDPLAAAVQRELARQNIAPAPGIPDAVKNDPLASAVRRNLPAAMRPAYDTNAMAKKKKNPDDVKPKRNSTEPTRHMPEPPAPKGLAADARPSGYDAVFEAAVGRLPLGDIDDTERSRVYAEIEKAWSDRV